MCACVCVCDARERGYGGVGGRGADGVLGGRRVDFYLENQSGSV